MVAADSERHSLEQRLKQISVKNIQASELKSMAATEFHQGIGLRVSPYPLADLSDILNAADSNPFLLLLDNVVDTHNLGALVRTGLLREPPWDYHSKRSFCLANTCRVKGISRGA